MFALLVVLVAVEITDISINKIYLFITSLEFPQAWNLFSFVAFSVIFSLGQYFILNFVKRSLTHIRHLPNSSTIRAFLSVRLSQFFLVFILALIIAQMLTTFHYNTFFVLSSIWVSYGLAILMLVYLSSRFFYWFTYNRQIVLLLYGLSTASIVIDITTSLILSTTLILSQPFDAQQIMASMSPPIPDYLVPLNSAFNLTSILSFVLTWVATVIVMRNYSKRLRFIIYWIAVSIPLVYFLTQFQPLFIYVLNVFKSTSPVIFAITYTIIFSASKPLGGLLFAAAFWITAKTITNKHIQNSMILAAFGLALIFGSEQAIILVNKTYPPFGLPTVSFLGLSSFLVLIGVYSSAVTVAQDSSLRHSIKAFTKRQTELLGNIGTAEMTQVIERRVVELAKVNQNRLEESSGVESSLTEKEIKEYLEEVIDEVRKGGER